MNDFISVPMSDVPFSGGLCCLFTTLQAYCTLSCKRLDFLLLL